jgi:hypothetical protein
MAIRFITTSCNGAQHIRGDGNRVIGSGGWSGLQARALDRRLCKLQLGVEKRVAGNVANVMALGPSVGSRGGGRRRVLAAHGCHADFKCLLRRRPKARLGGVNSAPDDRASSRVRLSALRRRTVHQISGRCQDFSLVCVGAQLELALVNRARELPSLYAAECSSVDSVSRKHRTSMPALV